MSSVLIPWVQEDSFPGEMWPVSEADQSPPFSGDIKNAWRYTFTVPCVFMACRETTLF